MQGTTSDQQNYETAKRTGKAFTLYLNISLVDANSKIAEDKKISLSKHLNQLMKQAIRRESDRIRKKSSGGRKAAA